jgi:lipopolysaccharide transport system permease protein
MSKIVYTAEKPVAIYKPNQRHDDGLFETWVIMIKNIIRSRELIWVLFRRDFVAVYKKAFIGYGWMVLSPLIGIASWIFMQATGVLQPGDTGVPYPAYVLVGSSMWGLYMGFFEASSRTLGAGSDFIMQVSYPHEALMFKEIASHLSTFVVNFMVVLIAIAFFGVLPSWQAIFFPIVVLPLLLVGAAIGLITAMISVVAFDINKIINVSMGLVFFIVPIVYSDSVPDPYLQLAIKYNPLTYLICSARDILLFGRLYEPMGYAICSVGSFVFFMISWRLFYVSESKIVERMI